MKKAIQLLLALIAIVMIYLGIANSILAPALTGVGFILILIHFKYQQNDGRN
jgi:hypothetical protein